MLLVHVVSREGEPEDSNSSELANNESNIYQSFECFRFLLSCNEGQR